MKVRPKILLLHPPYDDVTRPYHSLSYVAPPLVAAGFQVDVLDLNALWFRSKFRSSVVHAWKRELEQELDRIESRTQWSVEDQKRAVRLMRAVALANDLRPEDVIETLTTERFYDYAFYKRACDQIHAFEIVATVLYEPFDFVDARSGGASEPNTHVLVAKALGAERLCCDIQELLTAHAGDEYLMCGVTFPFVNNLIPGMAVMAAVTKSFPRARRVAGGTAITALYKYRAAPDALEPLGQVCDHLYLGEAELGIVEYANFCLGETALPPAQIVTLGRAESAASSNPSRYVSLSRRGNDPGSRFQSYDWQRNAPLYDWIDWSLYLSPARQVNYSPTRGCFWNKCAFCDYGLNEGSPTSPSREMDVDVVVEHLKRLEQNGIQHVYLAVDAISPAFLKKFAGALIAQQLGIKWSCESYITPSFSAELIDKLELSGMRTASFGLESGSSKVLELMDKGPRRVEEVLLPALEHFRRSSIGLQPLFFFGFPGETDEDRQATVDLLRSYRDVFTVIPHGGTFDLLPMAKVARTPERYGVARTWSSPGHNVVWRLDYELTNGEPLQTPESLQRFNDQLGGLEAFQRPWAGSNQSFHSKLYIERFGRGVFHEIAAEYGKDQAERWYAVEVLSAFDIGAAIENVLVHEAFATEGGRKLVEQTLGKTFAEDMEVLHKPIQREPRSNRYNLQFRL